MNNGWTQERRERQSKAIQRWQPWQKATGPKSEAGKAKVARNAFKGGKRPAMRAFIRNTRKMLDGFNAFEQVKL